MKKTISILVIVAMMLASLLAIVPLSAADPEGTAVTNEAEFLAMTADGTYYLANDIVLSQSFSAIFTGTLDGNGKTITVNNTPVFKNLSEASVKNLKIVASATKAFETATGALASIANGTYDNITVEANFVLTDTTPQIVGGIFGQTNADTQITNSVTYGVIEAPETDATNKDAGVAGFVGKQTAGTITIQKSTNNINIEGLAAHVQAGGFLGLVHQSSAVLEECINYGNIAVSTCGAADSSDQSGVGGIVGALEAYNNLNPSISIKNCRNYGNVDALFTENRAPQVRSMGGILGRVYGAKTVYIEGCVNSGKITHTNKAGWTSAGGILGMVLTYNYPWSTTAECDHTVKNCVNLGEVGGSHYDGGIVATYFQINSTRCVLNIENCANYADILSVANYSAGIFNSTSQGGSLTLNIKNCYNEGRTEGKYAGGIVCYYNGKVSEGDAVDKEAVAGHATVTISNTINAGPAMFGEEPMFAMMNTFTCDGEILKVTNCGTTVEGEALVRPDKADIEVTGESIALADLLAIVPGNSKELGELLVANKDNDPADYSAGWGAFTSALELAELIANKASSAEDVKIATDTMKAAVEGLVLNTNIVKTELDAAITTASAYEGKEADYTTVSWTAFAKALADAKEAVNADKQSVINKAATELTAAIAGLEVKADFDALNAEIAKYEGLVETEYTVKSWASFATAFAEAKNVSAIAGASASVVATVLDNLATAGAALAKKADAATLQAKVDEVKSQYAQETYTAKTYGEFVNAVVAANTAIEENDLSEAEIAKLIADIDTAIAALVKRATLEEINALLATCAELKESDYTADTWAALTAAIEKTNNAINPNVVMNLTEAREAELVAELQAVVDALIRWADYTEIDALIAELNALKAEDYTEASWKSLQDAIKAVDTLKANEKATEKDAEKALADIKAAKDALKQAEVPTEQPTEKPTDASKQSGCGGFVATSVAVIAVVSVLGCAITFKKEEK